MYQKLKPQHVLKVNYDGGGIVAVPNQLRYIKQAFVNLKCPQIEETV